MSKKRLKRKKVVQRLRRPKPSRRKRRHPPATADQIAELVRLGLAADIARNLDTERASDTIRNMQNADGPKLSSLTAKPPVLWRESEPREATDADLARLKRLGGKYGNRHRRT